MSDINDEYVREYARLRAIRNNVEQIEGLVPESFVIEFHEVLTRLENLRISISEFRVPSSEVFRKPSIQNFKTGVTSYSKEKYVDKQFLLTKLDSIIGYFEIITSPEPKKIGFRKPED